MNKMKNQRPRSFFIIPFLLTLVLGLPGAAFTQVSWVSPYRQNWGQESLFLLTGATTSGIAYLLKGQDQWAPPLESFNNGPLEVNSFDRIATRLHSPEAADASDLIFNLSCVTPALLLAGRETRQDIVKISLLFFETVLINAGLTQLTKYTFRRPRPYLYDSGINLSQLESSSSYTAFVSGHTSGAAANCFFMARVFSDYYPQSPWKPVVWGVAAAVPALVGYLRVRAGKHYPTDVIAGYALGASVGLLVPYLHQSRRKASALSFAPGFNGGTISWRLGARAPEELPLVRD